MVSPGSMRPTLFPVVSRNQTFPSGPAVRAPACDPLGIENSLKPPVAGTSRPPLFVLSSVNQRFPSAPVAIPAGLLIGVAIGYSVTAPAIVIRPMRPAPSTNHIAPSGPAVMAVGALAPLGKGRNSLTVPAVVTRP